MVERLRTRVFYGWWIAAAGCAMQLLISALLNQSFGAYARLLRDEFQWSKTLFSAAFSMSRVETGFLGPVEGILVDRFGPRTIMRIGVVVTALGFFAFSQVNSAWTFLAAFTVMSIGASLASFMPSSVAVVNWFERYRSRALAVLSLGFAAGGVLVPVVVFFLERYGWRATVFAAGVLVLVVGLPLAQVIRHRPEPYGLQRDGGPGPAAADGSRHRAAGPDFTIREALRAPAFWFLSLGHGSALLIVSALQVHLVLHMTENLGYSLAAAASVVAMLTAAQVVGQVAAGATGDRWDKRLICVACMGMHAAGILFLAYATAYWMLLAFVVLHGVAWGYRGPMMGALRADYFGGANFGAIMGTSSLIVMLGTTAGPLVAGVLADRTGNYEAGFTVLAILAALGSVFFILARPPAHPDRPTPVAVDTHEAAATPAG